MTPFQFAQALLSAGGYPLSSNNLSILVAWQAQEGGHYFNPARFNPLNTSQDMPGSTLPFPPNSAAHHIRAYTSWDQGVAATLKTLNYGAYSRIRDAFAQSASPEVTMAAINASPWTGGAGTYSSNVKAFAAYGNTKDPFEGSGGYHLPLPASSTKAALGFVAALALGTAALGLAAKAAGYWK